MIAMKTKRSKTSFVACIPDKEDQFDPISDFRVEYLDHVLDTKKGLKSIWRSRDSNLIKL